MKTWTREREARGVPGVAHRGRRRTSVLSADCPSSPFSPLIARSWLPGPFAEVVTPSPEVVTNAAAVVTNAPEVVTVTREVVNSIWLSR